MYFNDSAIQEIVKTEEQYQMAKTYHLEDCVKTIIIEEIEEELYYISAKVDVMYYEVPCNMMVDHGHIEMHHCTCTYDTKESACAHIGAILLKINDLAPKKFPFHYTKGEFTSLRYEEIQRHSMELEEKRLAYQIAKRQEQNLKASMTWLEEVKQTAFTTLHQPFLKEHIHLLPELVKETSDTTIRLQYRIGDDRYYMIKDLHAFLEAMNQHQYVRYGKHLAFRHDLSVLDASSKAQFTFLKETLLRSHSIASRDIIITNDTVDAFFDCYENIPEYAPIKLQVEDGLLHVKAIQEQKYTTFHLEKEEIILCGAQYLYAFDGRTLTRYVLDEAGVVLSLWKKLNEAPLVLDEAGLSELSYLLDDDAMRYLWIEGIDFISEANKEETIHIYGDIEEDGSVLFYLESIHSDASRHILSDDTDCYTLKAKKALYYLKEHTETMKNNHMYGFSSFNESALDFLVNHLPVLASICTVYVSDRLRHIRPTTNVSFKVGVSIQNQLLEVDMKDLPYSKEELLEIYHAYRKKKKYHLLKNGELLHLEDESLHKFHELVTDLDIDGDDLILDACSVPLYRALSLPQEEWYQTDETYTTLHHAFTKAKEQYFPLPEMYKKSLKAYQVEGFQWMSYMKEMNLGGILADDMGLGKTIQVIALLESDHPGISLVVTPASLLLNWEDELIKFHSSIRYRCVFGTQSQRQSLLQDLEGVELLITSYDYLKRDIELYRKMQFHYVILDEAQNIKNPRTQNARTVKQLNAKHRFALSGTPIENSLAELWSIFDFILPGYLYRYAKFQEQYEKPILKEADEEKKEKLQRLVQPFILRRTKQQVLKELPVKREKHLFIPFNEEGKRLYYANLLQVNQKLQKQMDTGTNDKIEVFAMLTRLRQLCCEPRLLYEDIKEPSAKLEACMDLTERLCEANQKILLFSSFTSMLSLIGEELEKRGIRYYVLKGDTSKIKRRELVNAFQKDDTPVFLISLKAGGTGLNLTAAEAVIHYDPWWNVSAQNQATDRAHRIGQNKHVQVYQLIMKNSIEEKIQKLQKEKQKLSDTFIVEETGQISMKLEDVINLLKE